MKDWYTAGQLVYGASNDAANVSDPARSLYMRPQEVHSNMLSYGGAKFAMAHYLSPIAIENFQIASSDHNIASSVIYQNPG